MRPSPGASPTGLAAAIAAAFLLSGCAGGQGASLRPGPTVTGSFDEATGALHGFVTDDELRALAGVQVAIVSVNPPASAVTTATGEFSLSYLAPGRHTLAAQKLGYESITRFIEVRAGAVTPVDVQLVALPVPHAYVEILQHVGTIGTGVGYVRSATCFDCGDNQTSWFMFGGFPDDFQGMVVEARWATPDWLGFDLTQRSEGGGTWYRTRSTSPVKYFVERCGNYTGSPHFGSRGMPCADAEVKATQGVGSDFGHLETWYIGQFQDQTHALDPVCAIPAAGYPGYPAGCYGIGFAQDLRWETWLSIFHLELPPGAEDYTALPDG